MKIRWVEAPPQLEETREKLRQIDPYSLGAQEKAQAIFQAAPEVKGYFVCLDTDFNFTFYTISCYIADSELSQADYWDGDDSHNE